MKVPIPKVDNTVIIMLAGVAFYYAFRLLETAVIKDGPLTRIKWYYLVLVFSTLLGNFVLFMKSGLSLGLVFGAGFLFLILAVIPLCALIFKDLGKFKQLLKEEWRGLMPEAEI